jgi:uncharacterized protein YdaU (DUF1376 family)
MTTTWMPFFVGDYTKNTMHLSTEEHGAYLLLIIHYWCNGKIRNDKKIIKNIAKISTKKLQNVLAFFEEKNGYFEHSGIEHLKQEAIENKDKQRKRTEAARQSRLSVTEPVTSIVTSSTSSSSSPSSIPTVYLDADDRQRLFVEISLEVQKLMQGRIMATQGVYKWLDAGADKEMILETMKVLIARKGGEPPNALKYFDQAIADAIAAKNNPLPKGNTNGKYQQTYGQNTGNYTKKPSITEAVFATAELIRQGKL